MRKKDDSYKYIEAFPKLKKWINECICCRKQGYEPSMKEFALTPDDVLYYYFLNIKEKFEPLQVNKYGICPQCEKILKDSGKFDENDK